MIAPPPSIQTRTVAAASIAAIASTAIFELMRDEGGAASKIARALAVIAAAGWVGVRLEAIASKTEVDVAAWVRIASTLAIVAVSLATRLDSPWVGIVALLAATASAAIAIVLVRQLRGRGGLARAVTTRARLAFAAPMASGAWLLGGGATASVGGGHIASAGNSAHLRWHAGHALILVACIMSAVAVVDEWSRRGRELEAKEHLSNVAIGSVIVALIVGFAIRVEVDFFSSTAIALAAGIAVVTCFELLVDAPTVGPALLGAGAMGAFATFVSPLVAAEAASRGRADRGGSPFDVSFGVAVGVATYQLVASHRRRLVDGPRASAILALADIDFERAAERILTQVRAIAEVPEGARLGDAATPRLLVTTEPSREISLDAAGVAHTHDYDASSELMALPSALSSLLLSEPFGIVRTDVLRALRVRRPDLRAALAWLDRIGAAAAVALIVDGELEGVLVVPIGQATSSISFSTAEALAELARPLATRLSIETTIARSLARERVAEERSAAAQATIAQLRHDLVRDRGASNTIATLLAVRAEAASYAPASRICRSQIDAAAILNDAIVLTHAAGVDPLPLIARTHLLSRRRGALVVVDACRAVDVASSVTLAARIESARDGTLAVLSADRLSKESQELVARSASAGVDGAARLIITLTRLDPVAPLAEANDDDLLFEPSFSALFTRPIIAIPRLRDRLDDLRALALDRLGAVGMALDAEPIGISDAALAMLLEHDFPGDDLELDAMLVLAADRVRSAIEHSATKQARRVERAHIEAFLHRDDRRPPTA